MDDIIANINRIDDKVIILFLSIVSGAVGFIIKTIISSKHLEKHHKDFRNDMIEIERMKAELSRELELKKSEYASELEKQKAAYMKHFEEIKINLAKEYEISNKIADSNYSAYCAFRQYFDVVREVSCYQTVKKASIQETGDLALALYDQVLRMQWKNIQDDINRIRDEYDEYAFYIPSELGLRIREFELDITNLFLIDEFTDEAWQKVSNKLCNLVAELDILAHDCREWDNVERYRCCIQGAQPADPSGRMKAAVNAKRDS